MKTTIKRIIFTAISILLLCAMVFGLSSCAFFKKNFAAPHEYFKYVQERGITTAMKNAVAMYDTYKNAAQSAATDSESIVKVSAGEDTVSAMEAAMGMDMSWVNDLIIKISAKTEGKLSREEMSLLAKDDMLASLSLISDAENGVHYVSIPEFFAEALKIPAEYVSETDSVNIIEMLPDGAKVARLINKYVSLYLSFITAAEKKEDILNAGDVMQKCTVLTVKFTDRELSELSTAIISEAKEDAELKELVFELCEIMSTVDTYEEYDGEQIWAEFVDEAENILAEIEDEQEFLDDETDLILESYVDGGSNIIGWDMEFVDDDSSVFYRTVQDGGKFGIVFGVISEGYDTFFLEGSGAKNKDKTDFEMAVYAYDEELLKIKATEIDYKLLEKECRLSGTVELFVDSYIDEYTMAELGLDESMSVSLVVQSQEYGKAKIAIMLDGEEAIALNVESVMAENGGEAIVIPTNFIEDEEEWMAGMSFDKFFENIQKSSLPDELIQVIQMAIMSAMMGGMIY